MHGDERRQQLLQMIQTAEKPISATAFAEKFGVSRQVIVQDVALIRAQGHDILSTNRGYKIELAAKYSRIFKVSHTDEQIEEELNAIVDLGASIDDVFVNHKIYGKIHADLNITSRREVSLFLQDLKSGKSAPLKNITSSYHYHTISADSEEILDLVENVLREKNFLI